DRYPGLFSYLASRGTNDRLAYVLGAAGDRPEAIVGALDQKYVASVVLNERRRRDHNAIRGRRGRIVVVVKLRHPSSLPLGRLRCCPHLLEALRVGVEQVSAGQPAQVQRWSVWCPVPVHVRVDDHLVVVAEDRVVEGRAVATNLDASCAC